MGDVLVCANCGKEGISDNMNTCNKCKQVKYCNAVCKKVHKKKHKKDCEEHIRLAAEKHNDELRRIAKLHDIELFKQPPQLYEDCPICFLLLPSLATGRRYMTCCGKVICSGCSYAPVYDHQGNEVDNDKCPFCRTPESTSREETIERDKKRMEADDAEAFHITGYSYYQGTGGYPQDYVKALESYHRAGELGYAEAYTNIGHAYMDGRGAEIDKKKAIHFYELAAMGGSVEGRYYLGLEEEYAGNTIRALKHYMISTGGGHNKSLNNIKKKYTDGYATKEDYFEALQSYQVYLGETKSIQRDKAAAADEEYRCY